MGKMPTICRNGKKIPQRQVKRGLRDWSNTYSNSTFTTSREFRSGISFWLRVLLEWALKLTRLLARRKEEQPCASWFTHADSKQRIKACSLVWIHRKTISIISHPQAQAISNYSSKITLLVVMLDFECAVDYLTMILRAGLPLSMMTWVATSQLKMP